MRLNRTHYIVLLLISAAVTYLTISGYKTSHLPENSGESSEMRRTDLNLVVEQEKKKLSPVLLERMLKMEADTSMSGRVIMLWDSLGKPIPAAFYAKRMAEKGPSPMNWFIAGSKFYNLAMMSNDSEVIKEAGNEARTAFETALELDPNNLDAKNALAACYVDMDHDIMKGVGLLKQVLTADSNNVQALFTLGMLSVQSGQLEKAQQRFEKLITLQPFTAEYYYYLGEVYARQGNKEKAIVTYGKCKTLLTDKKAQEEIESLINKLKSI